jgi:RNA polymerase sigma-70 factor (ECF subfamily)
MSAGPNVEPLDVDPEAAALRRAEDRGRALADLFERHRERLLRMVRLRMDPALRARLGASDVLQDAYLELARRVDEYAERPALPAFLWMRFVTAERILKAHRFHARAGKRAVGRQVPLGARGALTASTDSIAEAFLARDTSPTQGADRGERRERVLSALGRLKPADREMIALRHFEGLTAAEAAREVGIGVEAATKRYLRALERLRDVLGPAGPSSG